MLLHTLQQFDTWLGDRNSNSISKR